MRRMRRRKLKVQEKRTNLKEHKMNRNYCKTSNIKKNKKRNK